MRQIDSYGQAPPLALKVCHQKATPATLEGERSTSDKRPLHGSRINGIKVFDSAELPALIENLQIRRVLLAMPAASRRRRREILERLEPLGVHVQSLPDLSEIISGRARLDELREVDAGDLLGRDPVPADPSLFERSIRGRCVMVTGAQVAASTTVPP